MLKVLSTSLILVSLLGAKVVLIPTIGKQVSTPKKEFKDDEVMLGVGLQAYINENFAVDMRIEASDGNLMGDGGRSDLERGSANLLYDFKPKSKVSPYIFGGGGYEKLHRVYLDNKSQPFYQVGSGLKFKITDSVDFITEVRYLRKADTKDSETIATCGIGVTFGNDECKIDCNSLDKAKAKRLDLTYKPKLKVIPKKIKQQTPKVAIRSVKHDDIFDDEVIATTRHAVKREPTKVKSGGYIQVAAFSQKSNLIKTVKNLKKRGFKIKILKKPTASVVLVGPYSKMTINTVYRSLKKLHKDAFFKKI